MIVHIVTLVNMRLNNDFFTMNPNYYGTYIGVELADKAGKIVVLEVIREEVTSKFRRAPYYKSSVIFTPGDDMVSGRVVHELVSFGQEWGGD